MELLPGLDFTAIDFEAANSDRASACAVGVGMMRDGLVTDSRSWLIRPYTGIDSFDFYASRIHSIDASMVASAPTLPESTVELAAIIGDRPVLAHNIGYDGGVLRRSYEIAGLKPPTDAPGQRCALADTNSISCRVQVA